jgi:hypothetical protein
MPKQYPSEALRGMVLPARRRDSIRSSTRRRWKYIECIGGQYSRLVAKKKSYGHHTDRITHKRRLQFINGGYRCRT